MMAQKLCPGRANHERITRGHGQGEVPSPRPPCKLGVSDAAGDPALAVIAEPARPHSDVAARRRHLAGLAQVDAHRLPDIGGNGIPPSRNTMGRNTICSGACWPMGESGSSE